VVAEELGTWGTDSMVRLLELLPEPSEELEEMAGEAEAEQEATTL